MSCSLAANINKGGSSRNSGRQRWGRSSVRDTSQNPPLLSLSGSDSRQRKDSLLRREKNAFRVKAEKKGQQAEGEERGEVNLSTKLPNL